MTTEESRFGGATLFVLCALIGAAVGLGLRAGARGGEEPVGESAATKTDPGMKMSPEPASPARVLIDLGNEKCPIMGGKVNPKVHSVWRGLRVGHCCPPCVEDLLADPERLLDEAGIEWREAAALAKRIEGSEGAERERLIAEAGKRWTVVGEGEE